MAPRYVMSVCDTRLEDWPYAVVAAHPNTTEVDRTSETRFRLNIRLSKSYTSLVSRRLALDLSCCMGRRLGQPVNGPARCSGGLGEQLPTPVRRWLRHPRGGQLRRNRQSGPESKRPGPRGWAVRLSDADRRSQARRTSSQLHLPRYGLQSR